MTVTKPLTATELKHAANQNTGGASGECSSNAYVCVLTLLCMCPHTNIVV
jgi:hypothetical protein